MGGKTTLWIFQVIYWGNHTQENVETAEKGKLLRIN